MTILLTLVGCGSFGREVAPLVQLAHSSTSEFVFTSELSTAENINGIKVVRYDEFLKMDRERYFNVALADSRERQRIAEQCLAAGAKPFHIWSPTTRVLSSNTVGEGSILCDFTMITSNVTVGKFFHANIYSYVAHDCIIGDYVTFAPGVKCNGNVVIGDHVYIGTGAVIKPGSSSKPLRIGNGAVIGMGAVVLKDVDDNAVVVGNPAKPIRKDS